VIAVKGFFSSAWSFLLANPVLGVLAITPGPFFYVFRRSKKRLTKKWKGPGWRKKGMASRKLVAPIASKLILMAASGFAYSHWNETMFISGIVTTGTWENNTIIDSYKVLGSWDDDCNRWWDDDCNHWWDDDCNHWWDHDCNHWWDHDCNHWWDHDCNHWWDHDGYIAHQLSTNKRTLHISSDEVEESERVWVGLKIKNISTQTVNVQAPTYEFVPNSAKDDFEIDEYFYGPYSSGYEIPHEVWPYWKVYSDPYYDNKAPPIPVNPGQHAIVWIKLHSTDDLGWVQISITIVG